MPRRVNPKHPRQRRSKKARGRRGLQGGGSRYNVVAHSGPAFAPKFPKEFSVSLREEEYSVVSTGTIQRVIVPILEFLGRNPDKLVQMYSMYTLCKVTAVTVHLDIATSTNIPFLIVGGVLPYSQAASVIPSDLAGLPETKVRIASVFGKTRMSWRLPAEKYLGNVQQTNLYWINKVQSLSSSPVSVEEPTFVLLTQHPTGATMDYVYQTVITYHVQFFDLLVNNLAASQFDVISPEPKSKEKDLDSSQITEFMKLFKKSC